MKLLRLGPEGAEFPAVGIGPNCERAINLSAVVDDFDSGFFAGDGIGTVRSLIDGLDSDGSEDFPVLDVSEFRVGAPIVRPHKIIGIGLNYLDHIEETGANHPKEPVIFMKASSSLTGPYDGIVIPRGSDRTDWEVELGVVIGRDSYCLGGEDEASNAIAGYCVTNDVSERHCQLERGGQWVKGKSFATFCPVGPWLVTPDSIKAPQELEMSLQVNGRVKQQSSTSQMLFGIKELITYVSQFMALEPGDLVLTGTPAGIGLVREEFLESGDLVEVSIQGLGTQRYNCT